MRWQRRYAEKNKSRFKVANRAKALAHYRRYPEKARARHAVTNALAAAKLVRPEACERCGTVGRVEAHHPDYSKPLEVRWLCKSCHREVDGRISFAYTRRELADGRDELVAVGNEPTRRTEP